jgi:hypothetical protein
MNPGAARKIVYLCAAHFLFWYSRSFFDHPAPARRTPIVQQLLQQPGQQLVFVRYWPQHIFQNEWVYNAADIDHAPIVWARDLEPSQDENLLRYYPHRTAWLLEPDATPPKLTHFELPVAEPPKPKPLPHPGPKPPTPLRFEQVR